jgi:hypothetical protein
MKEISSCRVKFREALAISPHHQILVDWSPGTEVDIMLSHLSSVVLIVQEGEREAYHFS